jgi:hypothetical protein
MRKQMRTIRPKTGQSQPTAAQQKRQRERYVEAGGFLQGYAPEQVMRFGYIAAGVVVFCVLVSVELLFGPLAPRGFLVRMMAAVAWIVPIVLLVSFLAPGVRLAWKDRKEQPKVIQGQLLGASSVSTSLGLGMIMLRTRAGSEQYLVPPEKLSRVPGNVVPVVLSVTPNLRHVRTVSVMGQRQMGRPEPPVPTVLKRLRLLPIATPAALALAAILGDDVVAFLPLTPEWLHAIVSIAAGALLAGGVFAVSFFYQRRLMAEVQALVPQS